MQNCFFLVSIMVFSLSSTAQAGDSMNSVRICNQVWMTYNLDVRTYRNGDPIPQVRDTTALSNSTTGAWCWYNNDSVTYAPIYGKLYNWYAVNDPRGLAPQDWHVPGYAEWTTLITCLGGYKAAGGKMKSTARWKAPNKGTTNHRLSVSQF